MASAGWLIKEYRLRIPVGYKVGLLKYSDFNV